MVKVHFVNHTHWDREWYFTTQDAQVLSDQLFSDVLDELEQHPEANFTFDGQISIIDEYTSMHPEAVERIKKLVNRKQLFIGPWYTQTDALLPTGEAIIRNLVIGIMDSKCKYGQPMMIGYLPDTFGFSAQLPVLLNQVGIKDFICWRGTNFSRQTKSVYFRWKGQGSGAVYAANFPFGYYTGQISVESKHNLSLFVKNRLDKGIKFEAKHNDNQEVLIPSGIDQMNIIHNISETLGKINKLSKNKIFLSSYPNFMNKLHLKKDLEVYQGELRLPTYSRVHRTIGSVRSQLKRKNFKLERIILRRVEPLMVIAQKSGIKISNGPVLKLWKKLLECQPHDTLGGSVSDNVAVDIEHRFKEGFEIANGIENYIKKRIAQRLELKENQVLIFNTDPIRFNGFKTIKIITSSKRIKFDSEYSACVISEKYFPARKNIMQQTPKGFEFKTESEYYELTVQIKVSLPGLGFKVIDFKNSDKTIACLETNNGNLIQNEYWKLNFHEGQFDLNSKQYQYTNFIKILDSGNDGDTYDYSPLRSDFERELSLNGKCKIIKSQNFQELVIHGSWKLPATLTDRIIKNPKLKVVDYVLKLKLTNHQKIIDGNLKIDNQILSHRLRLKIKTGIMSNYSVSEIHGAFVKHKNYPIDSHWDQEFVEKPVNIYNFDQAVGLKNENHSLFFLGKGMKEYEKVEDSLLVTLMSTTGQLGKPNLLWRPGRASGDTTSVGHLMTPTILAQEVGTNDFTFGILENSSEEDENKIANKIHSWFSQSISYQIQNLNLFVNRLDNKIWNIEFKNDLPRINEMSEFLNLKIPLVVVAIYPAYTIEKAFVIRLANYSNHKVDLACLKDESFYVSDALEKIDPTADYSVKAENMITLIKKY